MKKSLSLILAIAMVFSMFASVAFAAETTTAPKTAQEKFDVLKTKGIFEGINDAGDAGLDLDMNRAQAAKILVLLAGLTQDEAAAASFKDLTVETWAKGYIGAAKKGGLMEGTADAAFDPAGKFTTEQLAAVLVRLLKLEKSTDAVEGDVSDWAKGYVAAAIKAGLIEKSDDYTVPASREVLVNASFVTYNKIEEGKKPVQSATVKVVGAKKLAVEFAAKAEATFVVKSNNNVVNTKAVAWSEDKKTATLEFAYDIPAGDYVVEVTGATADVLKLNVKVEAAKVTKVQFTGDKLVINRGDTTKASIGYKAFNQYNEEVDPALSFTTSLGRPDVTANVYGQYIVTGGTLTIVNTDDLTKLAANTPVMFTALHADTSTFASVTANLVAPARIAAVDIVKLEAKDNKEIQKNGTAGDFKLILDLKDQYGNTVTDTTYFAQDVVLSVAGNSVVFGAVTYADKKMYLPVTSIPNGGKTIVTIVSLSTGNRDSIEIDVKDAAKLDTLTLTAPNLAPVGEKVEIPFTAVDQFGNAVKNPTGKITLTSTAGTIEWSTNVVKDTTTLKVDLTSVTAKGTVIITGVTETGKFVQLQFNTVDKAVPAVITGVNKVTALLKGATKTIAAADVVIKDQYGRDVKAAEMASAYTLHVTGLTGEAVTKAGADDTLAATTFTAAKKGSATTVLALKKDGTTINNSSYTLTLNVVEKADIASYEATVEGVVYAGGAPLDYAKALKVSGVLADGSKVDVFNSTANYEVSTPANVTFSTVNNNVYAAAGFFSDANKDGEATIVVTVKGATTTQVIPVTVKLSNKPSTTESLEVVGTGVAEKIDTNYVAVTAADINAVNGLQTLVNNAVKAVNQYGVEIEPTYTTYVSNYSTTDRTIGTLAQKDTFNVTVVVGTKFVSFKVFVK